MAKDLTAVTENSKVKISLNGGKNKPNIYEVDLQAELKRTIRVEASSAAEAREKAAQILETDTAKPDRAK